MTGSRRRGSATAAIVLVGGFGVLVASLAAQRSASMTGKTPARASATDKAKAVTPSKKEAGDKRDQPVRISTTGLQAGLEWLIRHQLPSGGWSQGEESRAMGHTMDDVRDIANVADTSMAALAVLRAGSTPSKGPYAANMRRAVAFVCGEIERSPDNGILITQLRGTRVQAKLGEAIDTFAAALLLAEVSGQMPDAASRARVRAALEKTVRKMEKAQQENGKWTSGGWAPALAQGMGSEALNRAAQEGITVSEKVRVRAEAHAKGQFDTASDNFSLSDAAGVELYGAASSVKAMRESDRTNQELEKKLNESLKDEKMAPAKRREALEELTRIHDNRNKLDAAETSIARKVGVPEFSSGFGSNGGEEFLSYLNIGESLRERGGQDWQKWIGTMTQSLGRAQNADGSWAGQHCITGRTFCTAAALMVLTIDRAPKAVGARIQGRGKLP